MKYLSSRIYYLILVSAAAALGGCADQAARINDPIVWGAAGNVVQAGDLYFADQPDESGLRMARNAGVEVVVNLRMPNEINWDERFAVESLGMEYLNIPVSGSGPGFDPAMVEQLYDLVNANPDRKMLLHCSSGNRAGAWYGLYLVEQKGYSMDRALPLARQTGLTRDALITRMQEYLEAS